MGLKYPIVQGPFGGGLSSVALSGAVSRLGGLGSYGCQPLGGEDILRINRELRAATEGAYALNLWVSDRDAGIADFGEAEYQRLGALFQPYFEAFGVELPPMPKALGPQFADQVEALLEARPPVFSFIFGIPPADVLERCRQLGIKTLGTATTVAEAVALEAAGVDAVVASGFEAGGHRAAFLKAPEEGLTGLFSLLPQVVDAVSIPVVGAGGIADGRGVLAALTLGAGAAQIGTGFLACEESNASALHRVKLFSEEGRDTTLTKVFTGRWARGMKSRLTEELKGNETLLAPYPMQSLFLSKLRAKMLEMERSEYVTFWAGQSAGLLKHRHVQAFFAGLVGEVEELLQRKRM